MVRSYNFIVGKHQFISGMFVDNLLVIQRTENWGEWPLQSFKKCFSFSMECPSTSFNVHRRFRLGAGDKISLGLSAAFPSKITFVNSFWLYFFLKSNIFVISIAFKISNIMEFIWRFGKVYVCEFPEIWLCWSHQPFLTYQSKLGRLLTLSQQHRDWLSLEREHLQGRHYVSVYSTCCKVTISESGI